MLLYGSGSYFSSHFLVVGISQSFTNEKTSVSLIVAISAYSVLFEYIVLMWGEEKTVLKNRRNT
jgi:hypothetical protein